MNVTLEDLLHAINIIGEDSEVLVDGTSIVDSRAVCPPVKITPTGREHFKQALAANVVVDYKDDSHNGTYVSDADEETEGMAWLLLAALAGYCYDGDFEKWFEGENAELI